MNVMTLGNHLRAHQQVELAFVQRIERALKIFVATNRITIQAGDAGLRKHSVKQFFKLLRTGPEKIYILAAAVNTDFWHRRDEAAIVANHFVLTLVMRHRDGAILAFQFLPAPAAQRDRTLPAPINL